MARITLECPQCGERRVARQSYDDEEGVPCPECSTPMEPVESLKAKKGNRRKPLARTVGEQKRAKRTAVSKWALFGLLLLAGPAAVGAILWRKAADAGPDNGPAAATEPPPVAVNLHPKIDPEPRPKPVAALAEARDLARTVWLLANDTEQRQRAAGRLNARGLLNISQVRDPLQNELLRQSLWLTAHHDFGLRAGDESLNEPPPAGLPADRHFRVRGDYEVGSVDVNKKMNVSTAVPGWGLLQGEGRDEHVVWEGTELFDLSHDPAPPQRVEEAERLGRGLFRKTLAGAGFEEQPLRVTGAAVPAGAEALLAAFREADAFAALRMVHAEVRAEGESPALLGALVRGYAQLGLMTNLQWTGCTAVFKARALLYAQRLVARDPNSPLPLWHRAYAAALAGLHALALQDLLLAGFRAHERPDVPKPAWVEALDAYLHFDAARLSALREKSPTPLICFLQFLVAEAPHAEVGVQAAIRAGRASLAANPEGWRVYDSLCRTGGTAHQREATQAGLAAFDRHLRPRLQAVPGLPDTVRRVLADPTAATADVYAALRDAGRPPAAGTPAWGTLAEVMQGHQYALTWHRLDFLANKENVSAVAAAADLVKPLAGHPLLPLVESFLYNPQREPGTVLGKLTTAPYERLPLHCIAFLYQFRKVTVEEALEWYGRAKYKADGAYEDELYRVRLARRELVGSNPVYRMEAVSPHAPTAVAQRIERGRPEDVSLFPEFERLHPTDPVVLSALAERAARDGRPAAAAAYWTRSLAASPDGAAYRSLAKAYWDANDLPRWEETLAAALQGEDPGGRRAETNLELARGYASRERYDKAEPFAVAAAAGGEGEGLAPAAECKLALRKWDEAEGFFRTAAARYTEPAFDWYFACRRTGKMDAAAAEKAVAAYLARLEGVVPQARVLKIGHYYLLAGKPDEAFRKYEWANSAAAATDHSILFAALLADGRGDGAARDRAMRLRGNVRAAGVDVPIISLFDEWFAVRVPPDERAVARAVAALPEAARPDADFFAGWHLHNRGDRGRAAAHWTKFLENRGGNSALKALATGFLEDVRKNGKVDFGTAAR